MAAQLWSDGLCNKNRLLTAHTVHLSISMSKSFFFFATLSKVGRTTLAARFQIIEKKELERKCET